MADDTARRSIRVVVIDDHAIVREGLRRMLDGYDDIDIVGTAATAADGLDVTRRTRPDVVMLDIRLPDASGLDTLAGLRESSPDSRVIVLTVYDQPALLRQAWLGGAAGYVLKDANESELIGAIRRVASGGQCFLTSSAERHGGRLMDADSTVRLSPRELEVLRLLVDGMSNREIAEHLVVGLETVKSHVSAVYRKLGVTDRAKAIAVALRSGVLFEDRT